MPAIATGKVLVTGASGYIAGVTIRTLLDRGFSVRGTVRSESKGAALTNIFEQYGGKFEFTIVEDMAQVRVSKKQPNTHINVADIFRTTRTTKLSKTSTLSCTLQSAIVTTLRN